MPKYINLNIIAAVNIVVFLKKCNKNGETSYYINIWFDLKENIVEKKFDLKIFGFKIEIQKFDLICVNSWYIKP